MTDVELVARAIWQSTYDANDDSISDFEMDQSVLHEGVLRLREIATAAISALTAAGWRKVAEDERVVRFRQIESPPFSFNDDERPSRPKNGP